MPGQNIKPGKHQFWITSEGYDEYTETIDIAPGETKAIKATLKGAPIGKLAVTGMGIEDSRISIDGAVACIAEALPFTLAEYPYALPRNI